MSNTRADRLSTREEVRLATIMNPEEMLGFCQRMGHPWEVRNERGELEAMDPSELEFLLHLQSMESQPLN